MEIGLDPNNSVIKRLWYICFQYGEENSSTSFVLEISWGETYPETPPTVSMDTFYNKHM